MTRSRSIRRRLLSDQILLILLLGGALMATTFLGARRAVETLSETLIDRAADQAEAELRRFFDPITAVVTALSRWDAAGQLPDADLGAMSELLLPFAERLPHISGITIARESGAEQFLLRADGGWRRRLIRADESGLSAQWLGEAPGEPQPSEYDPRTRPWFLGAMALERGSIFWTKPYVFFTKQMPGMTAALAYTSTEGVESVAALDVSLADLSDYARGIEVSEGGSVWIVSDDRRLLAWPDDPEIWGDRDPATALLERPRELGLPVIDDSIETLRRRGGTLDKPNRFSSGGQAWWVAGRRFHLTDQSGVQIIVLVPHADLLGERARLRWLILGATLVVLAAAVVRARILAGRFSEPIEKLVKQSDRIRQGDFEQGEPIEAGLKEVQQLADSQERMRRGLRTLMKLEGDLQVARQIQQKTFPLELPTLNGFEIAAWSQPADETGGDSYDVIGLTKDGSLTQGEAESMILMLADATGHGIGPALSVTQLRAMLRMAVRNEVGLGETAAHLSEQLYADLPKNRFITAWLGRLERDGTLTTFSGGQAPLLIYRAESGEVEVLNASATPLGLLPPMPVVLPAPTALQPGDVYVVLSDGFYEASNATGEEFEKERVIEVVKRHAGSGPSGMLAALRTALREFTDDAPLDDDRTAVIIGRAR